MSNALMEKWAANIETLGSWLSLPDSHAAETVARIDFDYVCVDMQHGIADYQVATVMLQAVTMTGKGTPICRVPWNEPGIIGRMLDAGARGIIIPMVNSVEEAQRAVAATKYPPLGQRSYGPTIIGGRAANAGEDYYPTANQTNACIPMIETRDAVENLDAILAVEGVDAIYVGPADLSLSYGYGPAYSDDNDEYKEVLEYIVERCNKAGKIAGIHSTSALAANRRGKGFMMQTISGDIAAVAKGSYQDLKNAIEGGAGDGSSKIY
ncbi:MAG: 2,4-dihydroxyhept-2-ene-1,7-dioic acid aldolase [Acidimicrobiaceae bacterium]|nr:2,4-dihydroxyhept-2-ene-1,7-dioic acid aldolase [Acidimicrobiaceae bacterium]